MTLEEAIKHCEEVALRKDIEAEEHNPRCTGLIMECKDCAAEHRQLAEWLKELKEQRERTMSKLKLCQEAVNWLINIMADIGKIEHRDLWHYEQALDEIKEMLESEVRTILKRMTEDSKWRKMINHEEKKLGEALARGLHEGSKETTETQRKLLAEALKKIGFKVNNDMVFPEKITQKVLRETHDKRTETQELKQEFLRMESYIDSLLVCSDAQKETLINFIARLSEYMPWYEDDDFEVEKHTPERTETHACDCGKKETHGDVIYRADAIDEIRHIEEIYVNNLPTMIDKASAQTELMLLPSAQSEIIRCKDCSKRYDEEGECPMLFIESVTYDDDGYIEVDDIFHDNTEDEGFCDRGERRTNE